VVPQQLSTDAEATKLEVFVGEVLRWGEPNPTITPLFSES
jgi:hypothetical protein